MLERAEIYDEESELLCAGSVAVGSLAWASEYEGEICGAGQEPAEGQSCGMLCVGVMFVASYALDGEEVGVGALGSCGSVVVVHVDDHFSCGATFYDVVDDLHAVLG